MLTIVIILTTLVSSFYYVRIVKIIYDLNIINLNQWLNISSKIKSYLNRFYKDVQHLGGNRLDTSSLLRRLKEK